MDDRGRRAQKKTMTMIIIIADVFYATRWCRTSFTSIPTDRYAASFPKHIQGPARSNHAANPVLPFFLTGMEPAIAFFVMYRRHGAAQRPIGTGLKNDFISNHHTRIENPGGHRERGRWKAVKNFQAKK